jgi:hypothetical protein
VQVKVGGARMFKRGGGTGGNTSVVAGDKEPAIGSSSL